MKVLILANNDIGLYKFRKELIEKLVEDHEVHICLPDGDFIPNLKKLGCKFTPCLLLDRHGTNPLKDMKLLMFYKKVIKEVQPDIVFTYTIKPNVYGGIASASLNIPYVVNVTGLGTAVENGGILQKITLILYKCGLRKAQKVFFQNKENQDFMLNHGVVKGAYDLLPGSGVNLKDYEVIEYPNDDTVEFAFIARVMKEKGIDQYLEAAEYIREKYPHTRFHVCGFCEDDYKDKLKEFSDKEIIIYHGLVSDMKEIYKKIACTIHPSYYPEGISNVLLESAASGRPIITTDRSGCREVIDDGVNGFIVKQQDSQDLIAKIERFMKLPADSRMKMGLAGRKKVEKEFDRKQVIDKYLQEIKERHNKVKATNNEEPIRVLQMIGSLDVGGSQAMIINLHKAIDSTKVQFDYIIDNAHATKLAPIVEELGARIYIMPKLKGANIVEIQKAWDEFFSQHKEYKVLHSHVRSYASIYLPIAKKHGVKTIIHSHSTSNGSGAKAIVKKMLQYPLRYQADYFMGCSKEAAQWLFGERIIENNRYHMLKNAVNTEAYRRDFAIREKYREDLKLGNRLTYIHVGRLHEAKNHMFLLEVFAEINKRNSNTVLLIVGDGELHDAIEKRIVELGLKDSIIMLGSRNDVANLLQAADVLLFPSLWEGLPVTVVEAQAAGLPCFISDTITKDVNISRLVHTLPLDIKEWVNAVCEYKGERLDVSNDIKEAGFDISATAKWLSDFYVNIHHS